MAPSAADHANHDDYVKVEWSPQQQESRKKGSKGIFERKAALALQAAIHVGRHFEKKFKLRNEQREKSIPLFDSQELVLGAGVSERTSNFFTEMELRAIEMSSVGSNKKGKSLHSRGEEEQRERFFERSSDGHYSVKFLHSNIYNGAHVVAAAEEIMMETKILMNLAPHPNICQLYGVNAMGADAFLYGGGKDGYFIIVDRISETLQERLTSWRKQKSRFLRTSKRQLENTKQQLMQQQGRAPRPERPFDEYVQDFESNVMKRLEIALDISSALVFLSDRDITFYLRPDKVGFDNRYGRTKLCDFGQAREDGQEDSAVDSSDSGSGNLKASLAKTDDIRILAYTAPEVLCQAPVTLSSDIYAFGILLWEILSLQSPFDGLSRQEHFEQAVMEGNRPNMNPKWPEEVQTLIKSCWDPDFRPKTKKVAEYLENSILFLDPKSFMMDDESDDERTLSTIGTTTTTQQQQQQQQANEDNTTVGTKTVESSSSKEKPSRRKSNKFSSSNRRKPRDSSTIKTKKSVSRSSRRGTSKDKDRRQRSRSREGGGSRDGRSSRDRSGYGSGKDRSRRDGKSRAESRADRSHRRKGPERSKSNVNLPVGRQQSRNSTQPRKRVSYNNIQPLHYVDDDDDESERPEPMRSQSMKHFPSTSKQLSKRALMQKQGSKRDKKRDDQSNEDSGFSSCTDESSVRKAPRQEGEGDQSSLSQHYGEQSERDDTDIDNRSYRLNDFQLDGEDDGNDDDDDDPGGVLRNFSKQNSMPKKSTTADKEHVRSSTLGIRRLAEQDSSNIGTKEDGNKATSQDKKKDVPNGSQSSHASRASRVSNLDDSYNGSFATLGSMADPFLNGDENIDENEGNKSLVNTNRRTNSEPDATTTINLAKERKPGKEPSKKSHLRRTKSVDTDTIRSKSTTGSGSTYGGSRSKASRSTKSTNSGGRKTATSARSTREKTRDGSGPARRTSRSPKRDRSSRSPKVK